MEAFRQRVIQERDELVNRRDKIEEFLQGSVFETLDAAEQKRMIIQYGLMNGYADILNERIAAFPK
jgi:hypothetical protein